MYNIPYSPQSLGSLRDTGADSDPGLIRATEAIAWSSIFPYAYYMIRSFEVPEHEVAFYASALVGVFTFGEFLTGVVWARVSDRIGRKPTLMLGTFCALVSALSFGCSGSVAAAIASRAFGGLFNPNVGLLMEEQRRHFLLSASSGLLGIFHCVPAWAAAYYCLIINLIGPVLGGLLADPVTLYPAVFPGNSIWDAHRYLLPNLAVGILQVLTLLLTFFCLRETHPRLAQRYDPGLSAIRAAKSYLRGGSAEEVTYAPLPLDSVPSGTLESPPEAHQLEALEEDSLERKAASSRVFTLQVVLEILVVSLLAFHKMSSDALMGTFLSLAPASGGDDQGSRASRRSAFFPHANGGFGFDTRTIGIIFLTEAVFRALIQPTFIPWLISKLGALSAFRTVLGLYPAMYLLTPFLPSLPSPLGLVALLPDLWIKVALSSVGYVCSAVL
ncbi:uncharacterized protein THITE_52978 [Thermothielavioides terrestris NRRL 8126]|uniref:Major facilitator superfamily (MFS) profile domain-containing protein n=1 Tax=Thermothielavioides terrestris (strain ATCC 38088 / NRRL 8126) TaxID=578455 RepID=G2R6N2_THETT|nr:uncharacterized protein THITE_52978 [Thermothielavioides terrestris NRRL 8126]AEO67664.1 hypothetical protein THITE_52978 [Thermothielavioides terrestris NRRL 8126]